MAIWLMGLWLFRLAASRLSRRGTEVGISACQYGASFFLLGKPVAVTGVSNLRIYAAMRGETPEYFLETRNAPGAFYSVAAKPKAE